jgi:hypothetical protein
MCSLEIVPNDDGRIQIRSGLRIREEVSVLRHWEGGSSVNADGNTSADDGRIHKYGRGPSRKARSLCGLGRLEGG